MSTRRAKQLIYGALYVLIFLAIVGVVYLILIRPFIPTAPAPCTSGCMPVGVSSINTSTVSVFETSPGHYTFLAKANNIDPDFGIENLNYSIDLLNTSGTVIQSLPALPTYLYPGQNKTLVVLNQAISQQFQSVALDIKSGTWITSAAMGVSPTFITQNIQTGSTPTNVTVSGQIVNSDIATYDQVSVIVLFKDASGEYIGATATEIDNVGPGVTAPFSVMYPASTAVDPANNDVFVYGIRSTVAQ
jgi:hypothetical protein